MSTDSKSIQQILPDGIKFLNENRPITLLVQEVESLRERVKYLENFIKLNLATVVVDTTQVEAPVILVIENDWGAKSAISSKLSHLYQVITANDHETGLQQAIQLTPDLIITELFLANSSSEEMISQLRAQEGLNEVPIILIIPNEQTEPDNQAYYADIQDYLYNPIDIEELHNRIAHWLSIKRATQTLRTGLSNKEGKLLFADEQLHDPHGYQQLETEFKTRMRYQMTLAHLGQTALSGTELSSLMAEVAKLVTELLDINYSVIWEMDTKTAQLKLAAGNGWESDFCQTPISITEQYFQTITSHPTIVENFEVDNRFNLPAILTKYKIRSAISVVIPGQEGTFGLLAGYTVKTRTFNDDEIHFLQAIANVLATAIERKRTEKALIESEERYRELFDNAHDLIQNINPQGNFIYVNKAWCEALGYSLAEVKQLSIFDVLHTSSLESFIQALQGQEINKKELVFLAKSGKRLILEGDLNCKRQGNQLVAIHAILRDITERKAAEAHIKEQAALLDKARDAISVWDIEGKILFWNKSTEKLYGWQAEEVIDQYITDIIYKVALTDFATAKQTLLETKGWNGEFHLVHKNGQEIIIESSWTLVCDNEGLPTSILVVDTDITDKKRIANQLLRTQRMESMGQLAGGLAHDMNNILAPLLMSAQLLRHGIKEERERKILDMLETNIRRGAEVVKQILWFTRGEEEERDALEVQPLINDLGDILKDIFPKSIQIETIIAKDLATIKGSPTKLYQVLLNICVNARDAMPQGGKLSITVENTLIDEHYAQMETSIVSGQFVLIQITDTGSGIESSALPQIFEPFFTTKTDHKNSGLGLSIALNIVKNHGGIIKVATELGKGTTFSIYLPTTKTSQAIISENDQLDAHPSNGETILVVDDEEPILNITKVTLENYGYRVLTASDGAEALATYATNKNAIKCVLMDILMPVMNGITAVRAIQHMDNTLPIIIVSGATEAEHTKDAVGLKVKSFLLKPYTAKKLLTTLAESLNPTVA